MSKFLYIAILVASYQPIYVMSMHDFSYTSKQQPSCIQNKAINQKLLAQKFLNLKPYILGCIEPQTIFPKPNKAEKVSNKLPGHFCPDKTCIYHDVLFEKPKAIKNHLIKYHGFDKDSELEWYKITKNGYTYIMVACLCCNRAHEKGNHFLKWFNQST